MLANGQEKAFTEREQRTQDKCTECSKEAKARSRAVGGADDREKFQWQSAALLASVQCAERAEQSRSSSRPAESPQQKPTQVL